MKNYYIALIIVGVIFVGSLHYKIRARSVLDEFPVSRVVEKNESSKVILLFFFSIRNCDPCLRIVEVLNNLSGIYKVVGLVPDEELSHIDKIREVTNAQFEIRGRKKFRKYYPNYYPTLYAINRKGEILFVIPGVPREEAYLQQFLDSFVHRARELLT